MVNIKKLLLSLSFLLVSLTSAAREYMFRHIEADEGLSNSQINTILQDSRGYMWFGTSSGLNRYDGYQMKVYRSSMNDVRSLPDSYIRNICEDASGLLWVETFVGYAIYNPQTDDFDRDIRQHVFQYGLTDEPTSVFVDKAGDFWFYVAGKGCYWYNVAQKLLFPFEQGEGAGMLPVGDIVHMTECKEGTLLVYNNGLLVCINGDMRRIVWMNDYLPVKMASRKHYYSAFVDKNENVWVYSVPGVRIYNKEQNKWITSMSALAEQWGLPADPEIDNGVMGMGQDMNGVLWLATRHHGLMIVDPQAKTVKWERASETDARSLKHNSMRTLYVSPAKDVVWAGAAKSGLAFYSGSMFKFHTDVRVDVTAIAPNGKDAYWVGTSKNGILSYNPTTRTITPLKAAIDLSKHEIFSLYAGREGALWVATNRGLVFRLQAGGRSVTNYQIVSLGTNPTPATHVITDLLEDDRGYLWIATLGAGLQRLDVRTGKLTVYSAAKHRLPSDRINSLELTRTRNLLMGTTNGVAVLDLEKNIITSYSGTREGNISFTSPYVNHVIEDHRGLWWIATRDGVNIYDTKADRLDVIGANEGLKNAVVLGVGCSGAETVWASTAGGICNIVVEKNDTDTDYIYRVYNYTENDGLQGYEFNQRSIWVMPDGEVAMGGTHGMNVFHPNEIVYNKKQPKVIFSTLRVADREVKVGEEVEGTVVMPTALAHDGQINLTNAHPSFSILFGSDDFSMPEKTRFQYKLEGFDDDWHECAPLRNGVTFTNLSPGKYVLKVKAVNGDGYSGNETSHLRIVVTGPFWTTPWAILIYAALLVVLVWLFMRTWKRNERLRIKKQLLADTSLFATDAPQAPTIGVEESDTDGQTTTVETQAVNVQPKVIAVDENAEYLTYINDCLSGAFRLSSSTDAEEAWNQIAEQRPDVVVLSVSSIESDVYFLCHRLKADADTANIPVMLLITRQMKDELEAIGMDDVCLVKPVTKDHLQKRLQLLLAGNDAQAVEELESVAKQAPTSMEEQLISNATRYVEENIARPDLSVEEMARHLGMSRAHLYKCLMAAGGKTPIEFIRAIRLKRATELLQSGRYNVSEVAYQVGFNNPRYFTKYFSEAYGITPSVYQDKYK